MFLLLHILLLVSPSVKDGSGYPAVKGLCVLAAGIVVDDFAQVRDGRGYPTASVA